jgi:signal peptidase II
LNRKYQIAAALGIMAFAADQTAKVIARALLSPLHYVEVLPGYIELRYAENTGIAFGMFTYLPPAFKLPLFTAITLVAVTIIIHLLRHAPAASVRLPAALGLVLAGALGNLTDRFHWPGVVDFIRVQAWPPAGYYWPTFNVADMAISAGIILLVIDTLFAPDPEETPPSPETPSASPEEPPAAQTDGQ